MNEITGVLETANGNDDMVKTLAALKKVQPNRPLHVTEFWPGRNHRSHDDWGDKEHNKMTIKTFEKDVTDIMFKANSSINYFMFFGGTNFGFMAGGEDNTFIVTSYDRDSPLTESGL